MNHSKLNETEYEIICNQKALAAAEHQLSKIQLRNKRTALPYCSLSVSKLETEIKTYKVNLMLLGAKT